MPVLSPNERREVESSVLDLEFIAQRLIMSDVAKARIMINVARLRSALLVSQPVPPVTQRILE